MLGATIRFRKTRCMTSRLRSRRCCQAKIVQELLGIEQEDSALPRRWPWSPLAPKQADIAPEPKVGIRFHPRGYAENDLSLTETLMGKPRGDDDPFTPDAIIVLMSAVEEQLRLMSEVSKAVDAAMVRPLNLVFSYENALDYISVADSVIDRRDLDARLPLWQTSDTPSFVSPAGTGHVHTIDTEPHEWDVTGFYTSLSEQVWQEFLTSLDSLVAHLDGSQKRGVPCAVQSFRTGATLKHHRGQSRMP